MCVDKDGQRLGIVASLRWLFGTDAEMEHPRAQEEAMTALGIENADAKAGQPAPQDDHFDVAMAKIAKMERALDRASSVMPARSLDQAMTQMFGRER